MLEDVEKMKIELSRKGVNIPIDKLKLGMQIPERN